ncbi:MAG: glycosyltransferase [Rhodobacteraceae bacterium]|nr:glycosyltransferase [Paracoccaceae bacterium]
MIPKIIHYIWVGNRPKPPLVEECINSWIKYCAGYKFNEWGNDKLKSINNAYVLQATAHKKWAFVSDYIRLFALYHEGGFYFDCDLELTATLNDFRNYDFITGFEKMPGSRRIMPVTALLGAVPKNPIIGDLLREYDRLDFTDSFGNPNLTLTTNTVRISKYFQTNFDLDLSSYSLGHRCVKLNEKSVIFPWYYFCTPKAGEKNFSVHHFMGSWLNPVKCITLGSLGSWKLNKITLRISWEEYVTKHLDFNQKVMIKVPIPGKKVRMMLIIKEQTKISIKSN